MALLMTTPLVHAKEEGGLSFAAMGNLWQRTDVDSDPFGETSLKFSYRTGAASENPWVVYLVQPFSLMGDKFEHLDMVIGFSKTIKNWISTDSLKLDLKLNLPNSADSIEDEVITRAMLAVDFVGWPMDFTSIEVEPYFVYQANLFPTSAARNGLPPETLPKFRYGAKGKLVRRLTDDLSAEMTGHLEYVQFEQSEDVFNQADKSDQEQFYQISFAIGYQLTPPLAVTIGYGLGNQFLYSEKMQGQTFAGVVEFVALRVSWACL